MPARVIPPVPGHVITLNLYFRNSLYRVFKSVMYYKSDAGTVPTFLELQTWAEAMFTGFGGEIDDIMDHDCTFAATKARYENNEVADITAFSTGDAIDGALGTIADDPGDELESLPPESALLLRKFTDLKGRQNQGRMFIPFISEQAQHDGIVDLLQYTAVRQAINRLMSPEMLGAGNLAPCHWNKKENKLPVITRLGGGQFLSRRKDRRIKEERLYILS